MAYLDLDELYKNPQKFFWGINRSHLIAFHEKDYWDRRKGDLRKRITNFLQEKHQITIAGPITMLTHLRYWGFCFNPVTFYYCFTKAKKKLQVIIADINNTPWNEKYAYVLKISEPSPNYSFSQLKKEFHVSPFFPMEQMYQWSFSSPEAENLNITMHNLEKKNKVFSACLHLKREVFSPWKIFLYSLKYPFITLKTFLAIYWQAGLLFLKKIPFFAHPEKH